MHDKVCLQIFAEFYENHATLESFIVSTKICRWRIIYRLAPPPSSSLPFLFFSFLLYFFLANSYEKSTAIWNSLEGSTITSERRQLGRESYRRVCQSIYRIPSFFRLLPYSYGRDACSQTEDTRRVECHRR